MNKDNYFINFSIEFISLISSIKDYGNNNVFGADLKFPNTLKNKKISIDENYLESINKYLDDINKLSIDEKIIVDWLKSLDYFIEFMRFAEKCFMYVNSDTRNFYCEIVDNQRILYFKDSKFKVKIIIENSDIKSPNKSPLESYLDDSSENYITMYTIEIIREYGKKMKNTFHFISNEVIMLDNDDTILLHLICDIIKNQQSLTFDEIVHSIILLYKKVNYSAFITWRDFVNDRLWIRKRKNK